jgi:ferredoxin
MADKDNKNEKNIGGAFYVDTTCIGCGMCHEIAPEFFIMNGDAGLAYVSVQPADDDSVTKCREALDSCPVEAIGDDGE